MSRLPKAFYADKPPANRHSGNSNIIELRPIAIGILGTPVFQSDCGVAIGAYSGFWHQGNCAVAVGEYAGSTYQGVDAVAVGSEAGAFYQSKEAVAIGSMSGQFTQGTYAVAVGSEAGQNNQLSCAIALGKQAGQFGQDANAIALGTQAGQFTQGAHAIAIGNRAARTAQHQRSIVLNALGTALNTHTSSAFYVAPIRDNPSNGEDIKTLVYDLSTYEIRYSTATLPELGSIVENLNNLYTIVNALKDVDLVAIQGTLNTLQTLDIPTLRDDLDDLRLIVNTLTGYP